MTATLGERHQIKEVSKEINEINKINEEQSISVNLTALVPSMAVTGVWFLPDCRFPSGFTRVIPFLKKWEEESRGESEEGKKECGERARNKEKEEGDEEG